MAIGRTMAISLGSKAINLTSRKIQSCNWRRTQRGALVVTSVLDGAAAFAVSQQCIAFGKAIR